MRFVAVLTLLVAAVTALPADQDGNGHSLEVCHLVCRRSSRRSNNAMQKRRTCAEAFPSECP